MTQSDPTPAPAPAPTPAPSYAADATVAGRLIDRFDVHAHFLPDFYREALTAAGHGRPDGMPAIPPWDAAGALATMDRLGIRTAMLSVSSPGVHFGDDAAAGVLARQVNEAGARLVREHAPRFGHFASVPLPDVAGATAEAVHALDVLQADGIVIETNHHGLYLGDPLLEPFYAALDARGAVLFIHPTSPACMCSPRLEARYPRPMLEFMFETTRSVADLVLSGVMQRFGRLRIIVPHAGAALPVLVDRIELMMRSLPQPGGAAPPSLRAALRALHFDLAGVPVPQQLAALLALAGPHHLHYGSDYPFTPATACELLAGQLESTGLLDAAARQRVFRDNSLALFSRFVDPDA